MNNKSRLDILLTERALTESRNKAQALIMAGKVRVNGEVITKSGTLINSDANITLDDSDKWASRGAKKLLKAFEVFNLDVKNKICADLGASTGGFTDVLLFHGAKKIYAVDVGYGQLIWRLANDPRVIVMDRTNARYLTVENFEVLPDFVTCDASFISLKLILPVINNIAQDSAVILIKPQFEAGRDKNKISKGVVKNKIVHEEGLNNIINFINSETKFFISGLTHSPIKGPEGNIEFLCWLTRTDNAFRPDVLKIVDDAHCEI